MGLLEKPAWLLKNHPRRPGRNVLPSIDFAGHDFSTAEKGAVIEKSSMQLYGYGKQNGTIEAAVNGMATARLGRLFDCRANS
jgi:hypothetical protein